ncbi:MAG: hypothetical protein JNK60_01875 [Acidobacteria bacterium]|nr:hypothetical protein [Acidobacteriota bacterium]
MSGAALDPASLETAVRFVARIFAEELARAFAPQLSPAPARPAPEETRAPAEAPSPSEPSASTATRPPRFGLRPPDAIGEDEAFGSALRFLEERAGETRVLFGGAPPLAPAPPEPAPEPTIGEVFALGRTPIR